MLPLALPPATVSECHFQSENVIIPTSAPTTEQKKTPAKISVSANDCRGFEDLRMVNGAGFEPAATGLKVRCSTG